MCCKIETILKATRNLPEYLNILCFIVRFWAEGILSHDYIILKVSTIYYNIITITVITDIINIKINRKEFIV